MLAYLQDGPEMSGPDTDSAGWKVQEAVVLKPQLIDGRVVDIICSVSYAHIFVPFHLKSVFTVRSRSTSKIQPLRSTYT